MPDYPICFGPYLRYAISTEFRNFALFDEESRLFFFVEFNEPAKPDTFVKAMQAAESPVDLGPSDDDRYYTLHTTKSAVTAPAPLRVWDNYVSRVELSLPLKPTGELAFTTRKIQPRADGDDPTGGLLIGVLDDGCPFAAAQFLKATSSGGTTTRVRAIWDQTSGRQPIDVKDFNNQPCHFGQTLLDFNYGLEFRRTPDKTGTVPRRIGLEEWIGLHLTPAGSIDEDSCYADAGLASLAHQASHGAHVMDVFAGLIPPSSRVGPAPPADRRDPPSWKPVTPQQDDPTGSVNDVVFVQFSRDCLRDATGVWLTSYVSDAVQYIMSHAHSTNTNHVVINLSYGPTTGPHNGTAPLEKLLTRFVTKYDGTGGKPRLEIVLASGNSFASEGHVAFCRVSGRPDHVEWTWRLPPDNTTPCFAEVWMKTKAANGINVTLTSPSGRTYVPTAPAYPPPTPLPQAGVDLPKPWGSTDTMWRLQVEATVAGSGALIEVAEHGDWTIKIAGLSENAEVDAYVARTDPNMNVRTGAKRSYFVDAKWERDFSADAGCKYINGEFDRRGSLIYRHGTLNGIATAQDDRKVWVAGSYILSNERRSPYSSAGPARPGPLKLRVGPDYLLVGDESYALGGIRAGGNRSGSVFRLIGTSAAAPQLARWLTRPALPPPKSAPTMGDREQEEERGAGNLEPP